MPPHRGHGYLIDYARARVDELTIIVFTKSYEPIPGELRYEWMKHLYPHLQVLHIADDQPTDFGNPQLWEMRMAAMRAVYPHQPDYVFSSEPYGEELARRFGAQAVIVDAARGQVPISATMIREQPLRYWEYIPECVRAYYLKRVAIDGARGPHPSRVRPSGVP